MYMFNQLAAVSIVIKERTLRDIFEYLLDMHMTG